MVKIKLSNGHSKKVRLKNRVLERFKIRGDDYRLELWRDRVILTEWDGKYWVRTEDALMESAFTNAYVNPLSGDNNE